MNDAREAQLLAIIADLAAKIHILTIPSRLQYGTGGAGPNWSAGGGGGGGSASVSAIVRNIGSGGGGAGVALPIPEGMAL